MHDPKISLNRLRQSTFRSRFKLGLKETNYLREKGMKTIMEHGREFIETRLAPAHPKNDGKQTPTKNHPVFIAQHATATCCRGCLQKWHNIPKGRALNEDEIKFMLRLIYYWLKQRPEDP